MKVALLLFADFQRNAWGRPSRLAERIGSRSVIEHTLARCSRVSAVEQRVLVVSPHDADRAQSLASAAREGWRTWPRDDGRRPHKPLLASARKWNLASWRGGLSNATWYDEFIEPGLVLAALHNLQADAALCVDGHQAALDPQLCEAMLLRLREADPPVQFVFTAAAPGLSGLVLHRAAAEQLVSARLPFGTLVTYRPEFPMTDPLIHATCVAAPALATRCKTRMLADFDRGAALLRRLFDQLGEDADAGQLCEHAPAVADCHAELPPEIELELTTASALPESTLKPRQDLVPRRELTDFDALARILAEFSQRDDALLTLNGHGDPLMHPRAANVLTMARDANLFGIAVESHLLDIAPGTLDALLEQRVDALLVQLDAVTPQTYARLHKKDRFAEAMTAIEQVEERRRAKGQPQPLLAPVLTKCSANLHELDAFFDTWIRRCGSAVIRGYNDYCATLKSDSLLHAAPPVRGPCRRLGARLTLLADGRVAWCGQAFAGSHVLGDWHRQSLREIWSGEPLQGLRESHRRREWRNLPLCAACREWFRP